MIQKLPHSHVWWLMTAVFCQPKYIHVIFLCDLSFLIAWCSQLVRLLKMITLVSKVSIPTSKAIIFLQEIRHTCKSTHTNTHTHTKYMWLLQQLSGKESACNVGDSGDVGQIPRLERSPGGHGNPLEYFCLENSKDRGASQVTIHRVAKSLTRLKRLSTTHTNLYRANHLNYLVS